MPRFGRRSLVIAALLFACAIVGYQLLPRDETRISALLDEVNRAVGSVRYELDGLKFKVYVRQPSDLDAIERTLSDSLRPSTPIVYLQADVCREDLLVEIEATGESGNITLENVDRPRQAADAILDAMRQSRKSNR